MSNRFKTFTKTLTIACLILSMNYYNIKALINRYNYYKIAEEKNRKNKLGLTTVNTVEDYKI